MMINREIVQETGENEIVQDDHENEGYVENNAAMRKTRVMMIMK